MAFEFLNEDDDSLSAPGESQPYQEGTSQSAAKKLSSFGMKQPESPQDPDAKGKYVKAKVAVEGAYGNAQKTLTRNANGQFPTGEQDNTFSGIDHDSRNDVDVLLQRVQNREHPLKIADDMRAIAGRDTVPPKYKELLHQGADQMGQAYQAQSTLDEMSKPGGALALGGDELENRYGSATADIGSLDEQIIQKQEQLKTTGYLNQPRVQQELQQLYNQKKQAQQTIKDAGGSQGPIQDNETTMDHVFTAAGQPRHDAIQSLTEMRRMVMHEGIDVAQAISPLTFIPAYTNLVTHIFSPAVSGKILGEMGPPPEQQGGEQGPPASRMPPNRGGQQSTFGSDKLEQDPRFQHNQQMIAQGENRHAQVVQELANSGTFKNVGDVLCFVLASFLLGPRVAGLIFTNMEKNGRLRDELNRLDHETTNLYHQQNSYIQLAQHARSMAAQDEHNQQTEREHVLHDWAMENYIKTKKVDTGGWSPEDKQIHLNLQQGIRTAKESLDKQDKIVKGKRANFDFKGAQAEQKKYDSMNQDYQKWINETVTPWYNKRGSDLIQPRGTKVDSEEFSRP
jgi:hypothetical protein